jgi:hypothetical protein
LVVLFCEIVPIHKNLQRTSRVTQLLCLLYVEYRVTYYEYGRLWVYLFVFLLSNLCTELIVILGGSHYQKRNFPPQRSEIIVCLTYLFTFKYL